MKDWIRRENKKNRAFKIPERRMESKGSLTTVSRKCRIQGGHHVEPKAR
jgi:hypothetical protein